MSKDNIKCSFCGRQKQDTKVLVAGISGHICDVCIVQAQDIVKEELSVNIQEIEESSMLLKPEEIKKHLEEYVIGQEEAKKTISVAVYNHYKRIAQVTNEDEIEIEKSNILLVGETGTGKTLLAKTIAKILNVPFCIADATVITEAGYVGEDVESILSRLLQAADYNEARAEKGIVFIDEIDKIARKSDNPSITRDVSGEGVQQGLLKLMEGATVNVPPQGGRKHPEQKLIPINTKNILFICGGAFDGLEKIIGRRLKTQDIGYKAANFESIDEENLFQYVTPPDIKNYGIIPELIGRMPVLSFLDPLNRDTLKKILPEPKNSLLKQYIKLFEMDDIKLSFSPKTLDLIVNEAIKFNIGARGLRSICEAIMMDAMFESPSDEKIKEILIDVSFAKEKLKKSKIRQLKVA